MALKTCCPGPTAIEIDALAEFGFYLGKKIGAGAYASVYRVAKEKRRRSIGLACKVFDYTKIPSHYRDKFFWREMKILMEVSHENIVLLHDILQRGTKVFIFMSLAENGDLLEWIERHGAIGEPQTRRWFQQLVNALQYLHQKNIAHRDLKCENILLSKHLNIKVGDFGFARVCVNQMGRSELSRTYCGSAAYAAPEVVAATPYNPKLADIWSLGVVLYIMLNGKMPFNDSNLVRLLQLQVSRKWANRKTMGQVSPSAESLLKRILEPDVMRRIRLEAIQRHHWLRAPQAGDWVSQPNSIVESKIANKGENDISQSIEKLTNLYKNFNVEK